MVFESSTSSIFLAVVVYACGEDESSTTLLCHRRLENASAIRSNFTLWDEIGACATTRF